MGHSGIHQYRGLYHWIRRVDSCCGGEGGIERQLHNNDNVSILASFLWLQEVCCVGVQELNNFVHGFIVRLSFDLGEILDGELGQNLVNPLLIAYSHGGFDPHNGAST